jgi:hypothetical protein
MRKTRTHIAETAARIRPLVQRTDGSCMSVMNWGRVSRLDAGLIRKARV